MRRRRMVFSGRVQGVGFRATTQAIAERHGVTGWVRNDPVGTVTAELQGSASQLDAVIGELSEQMGSNIEASSKTEADPVEGEAGFRISR
mgnify:FL=1